MIEDKSKNLKSKATALVTTVSLLAGSTFSPPANLPDELQVDKIASPPAIEYVMSDLPDDSGDDDITVPEEEKKRKFSFKTWYASRKFSVRLIISLAFAALCWAVLGISYLYFAPAMPVLVRFIVKSVVLVILGLITYAAIAKAILPKTPLKKILNWKPIVIIIVIACALSYGLEFIFSSLQVHI